MKIGFPIHPRRDTIKEVEWIGNNGFDFADIFIEPDKNLPEIFDIDEFKRVLNYFDLHRVGHTAFFLPIGSSYKELRNSAVKIIKEQLPVFKELGCEYVTVHADWPNGLFTEEEGISFQTESLIKIIDSAKKEDVKIMYESTEKPVDNKKNIKKILDLNPNLYFHADLGHLNLHGRNIIEYLELFKDKLVHVHMHDNTGREDLHLPIGTGCINWNDVIKKLKEVYDDTITLEVFSREKEYVLLSKKLLEEKWNKF